MKKSAWQKVMETLHGSIITLVFSISRCVGLFPMYHSAEMKECFKKKKNLGCLTKNWKKKKDLNSV